MRSPPSHPIHSSTLLYKSARLRASWMLHGVPPIADSSCGIRLAFSRHRFGLLNGQISLHLDHPSVATTGCSPNSKFAATDQISTAEGTVAHQHENGHQLQY